MWMVVVSWLNYCPGGRAFYSPPNNYAKGKSKPVNLHLFARNIQMVYICLFLMVSNCICQYKELLSFRVAIFSITYNGGKRSLASVLLFPYWNKRKATRTPNTVVGCTLARIVHNVVFRFQSKYLEIFCLLRPEEREREREKNFFSLFTFNILTHNFFCKQGQQRFSSLFKRIFKAEKKHLQAYFMLFFTLFVQYDASFESGT